ncbi:MAG: sporulation protein YqfD [Lachnospiraceae bacterium]|nr:sporulation protein YqfD [Lachnospiraceae bacterium]
MLSIIRFLRGYVKVYLTGFSPERFMNLCNNHHIELWDVEPEKDGYTFYIYVDGFFCCREFLRKTKTKVVVRNKLGLPFLMFRYRKRKLFFAGLLGCFLALFLATRFIWAFEISGNRQFTDDMFMSFLESQDVYYGMAINKLDIDSFEKSLREKYDYITWASAKIEGTKLHVTIKENEVGIRTQEEYTTGDLRASVSGTIVSMVTRTGVPVVKIGDSVNAGDMLISGIVPIMNDDETLRTYHETRADGDVIIESVIPYEDELALKYQKKIYTGNTDRLLVLGIGAKEVKIGILDLEEACEIITVRKPVKLLDNLYLPIIYGHNDYIGYEMTESTYTREEAVNILNDRFLRFCTNLEEKGVQIMKKDVKIDYKGDKVVVSGSLIIRENGITLSPITEFPEENSIE